MLSHFLDQWRSITSYRFVLNMVQGHHLQLMSYLPLFCNFWQFNVKATAAHHPIIQKEVDEVLSEGAIQPSSGGFGFYYSVFVVPKCTGGLWPILYLSGLIVICIYFLLRSLLSDMSGSLFGMVFMLSPLISRMLIYILIVNHHCHFLQFVWHNMPYQWKVFPFGLATAHRVFTALTKPILFLCHCKGFHFVIYLDDILVLVCSKQEGKRAHSFLCSLLVCL